MEACRPERRKRQGGIAMKKSLIVVALAAVVGAGTAAADSFAVRIGERGHASYITVQQHDNDFRHWYDEGRRQSVDERQARIAQRIEAGMQNGELTRREARQLARQLNATEQKERAFESDGRLNNRERSELHSDLDVVAQRLRFERRDDDRRGDDRRY
jgi:hypothetical protein